MILLGSWCFICLLFQPCTVYLVFSFTFERIQNQFLTEIEELRGLVQGLTEKHKEDNKTLVGLQQQMKDMAVQHEQLQSEVSLMVQTDDSKLRQVSARVSRPLPNVEDMVSDSTGTESVYDKQEEPVREDTTDGSSAESRLPHVGQDNPVHDVMLPVIQRAGTKVESALDIKRGDVRSRLDEGSERSETTEAENTNKQIGTQDTQTKHARFSPEVKGAEGGSDSSRNIPRTTATESTTSSDSKLLTR